MFGKSPKWSRNNIYFLTCENSDDFVKRFLRWTVLKCPLDFSSYAVRPELCRAKYQNNPKSQESKEVLFEWMKHIQIFFLLEDREHSTANQVGLKKASQMSIANP